MIFKLQDIINNRAIYIEIIASMIFIIGIVFHFISVPNDEYFVISGGLILSVLYSVKYSSFIKISNEKSSFDVVISRLLLLTLILSIIAIIASATGLKNAVLFLNMGLIMFTGVFSLMAYNRIWHNSSYTVGIINFYRIIILVSIIILLIAVDV